MVIVEKMFCWALQYYSDLVAATIAMLLSLSLPKTKELCRTLLVQLHWVHLDFYSRVGNLQHYGAPRLVLDCFASLLGS